MLRRWDCRVYDFDLLMGVLDLILESLDLGEAGGRGRRPKRAPSLYVKALVLKEMCKLSLRYAESCSSMHLNERIPKSTLSYWEINHGSIVMVVLTALFGVLRLLSYDYTVLDSTRFTDWRKDCHETFLSVRVRLSETLFPIHADTATSEAEFTEDIPPGSGFAFADGAFDAKPVLNSLAFKGYIPLVKPGKLSPGGYGSRMRDRFFNESLYGFRGVGEGVFGALTVEFGDRMKTRRKESCKTRILLRLIVYCLKIIVRWLYE